MKYNQFTEMYGTICSFHLYNQLISALERDWKQKIKSGNDEVTSIPARYNKYKMV